MTTIDCNPKPGEDGGRCGVVYCVNKSTLSYRAEIDGLRAIAIISVIFYHAKIVFFGGDWFEGGFLGVDIFFVISGYLITRLLLSELQTQGSFNFLNFYERRARRLLPMLFVVIFATMPFAWQLLLPTAFVEYAQSALAAIFFGSNFFFYIGAAEYGAESGLLKPLLHSWSLGVEEQFYLLFPVLAILAYKFFRKYFLVILAALCLQSLQFSVLMEMQNSTLNFFLPFSRFWELGMGAMLAYRELNVKPSTGPFWHRLLPICGVAMMAFGIAFFDDKTPHPSFPTLIPVLGVALIIGFASHKDLVGKILGSKPFVWLGLISYSAYLWHYPIFAFARIESGEPGTYEKFGWIGLTLILSILSYFVIERPFRNRQTIKTPALLTMLAVCATLIILLASSVIFYKGFEQRDAKLLGFETYNFDNQALAQQTYALTKKMAVETPFFLDVDEKILVIGNSHAGSFVQAMEGVKDATPNHHFLRGSVSQLACLDESVNASADVRNDFYNHPNYINATAIVVATLYSRDSCLGRRDSTRKDFQLKALPYLIKHAQSDGKVVLVFGQSATFARIGESGKFAADYVVDKYLQSSNRLGGLSFQEIKLEADRLMFESLNVRSRRLDIKGIARANNALFMGKIQLVCDRANKTCTALTPNGRKTFYDHGHWTIQGGNIFAQKLLKTNFLELLKGSK